MTTPHVIIDPGPSGRGASYYEPALNRLRYWAFRHVLGVQFPHTPPLIRGILVHLGLAQYYAAQGAAQRGGVIIMGGTVLTDPAVVVPWREAMHWRARKGGAAWIKELDAAMWGMRCYFDRFEGGRMRVIAVERVIRVSLIAPDGEKVPFSQRIDLEGADARGRVRDYDHKTSGRASRSTADSYALSLQFLALRAIGARRPRKKYEGAWINVISVNPRKKYADRVVAPRAHYADTQFKGLILEAHNRIKRHAGRDPWEYPCVCPPGYRCPAEALCTWGRAALSNFELKEQP